MNLKDLYNTNNNKQQIKKGLGAMVSRLRSLIVGIAILAACLYVCFFIWSIAASAWGLPTLTYIEFVATYAILFLIKLVFFSAPASCNQSTDIMEILSSKGPINE